MTRKQALQSMQDVMSLKRFRPKTVKVYLHWVARYIDFLATCSPEESREQRLGKFLTMLASREKVAASTQKQALCAIVFAWRLTQDCSGTQLAWRKLCQKQEWTG